MNLVPNLPDCPCGSHDRSRACCALPCSKLATPSLRKLAYDIHKLGRSRMTPSQKWEIVNGLGGLSLFVCLLFTLLPDSWGVLLTRYGALTVFTACFLYAQITPRPPRTP